MAIRKPTPSTLAPQTPSVETQIETKIGQGLTPIAESAVEARLENETVQKQILRTSLSSGSLAVAVEKVHLFDETGQRHSV